MFRTVAAGLAMMIVATACGARLTDEQRTAALGVNGVGGSETGDGSGDGTGDAGIDIIGGGGDEPGTVSGDTGSSSGGSSGTSPGGGGGPVGNTGGGGGTPAERCSGGATDIGVTATELKLGNVSLLSGAIQGFANTAVGATKAFVNYQNSLRGICGRALSLEVADDGFDSGKNREQYNRLKDKVFAFVGSLSVVDDGGVAVLKDTNIADVSLGLSDSKLALANNFAPTPIDLADGGNNSLEYARWLKANKGITKAGVVWPAQATARNRAQGYIKDYERAGIEIVYTAEAAITETNYTPFASQIKDKGVQLLTTTLEVNGMARLAKALKQQGYLPPYSHFGAQAYGQQFIDLAGDAAEGVKILVSFDIIEGSTNPLTKSFASWFAKTNPGLKPDFFAIQSWISGHMFATAATKAGANLTRDAILAQLNALTDYTAEGMIAPITPGKKRGPRCFLVAEVSGARWKRDTPAEGFICP